MRGLIDVVLCSDLERVYTEVTSECICPSPTLSGSHSWVHPCWCSMGCAPARTDLAPLPIMIGGSQSIIKLASKTRRVLWKSLDGG